MTRTNTLKKKPIISGAVAATSTVEIGERQKLCFDGENANVYDYILRKQGMTKIYSS